MIYKYKYNFIEVRFDVIAYQMDMQARYGYGYARPKAGEGG